MKIPSLTKIPQHQKFSYAPRFYDPIKEDIEQRTERIRKEMGRNPTSSYQSSFQHAFGRRSSENRKSNITQLVIIMLLMVTIFGYIYYGNVALYLILIIAPVYIFVRKRFFVRKR